MKITDLSSERRSELLSEMREKYEMFRSSGISLDMSRGNPPREQLSLNGDILNAVTDPDDCLSEDGTDCRNYGVPYGLREARELFSQLIQVPADNIIIGSTSSLNLLFDTVSRAVTHGLAGSPRPWGKEEKIKFICPVPGYDRHYKILEYFGIEMITVPFTGEGPDMDQVEKIAAEDPSVKGIICVPVYSNYTGDVYSPETVVRLARMETKAADFVVMYDDAYVVHDLYGVPAETPSFYDECVKAGHPERPVIFASTSKMSFAGGGICCVAFGDKNLELAKKAMAIQFITHDKINQLRHVRVLKDLETVRERMNRFGSMLLPKFEAVEETFERFLGSYDLAEWSKPKGGYFICFRLRYGGARRIVEMCAQAGVKLTPAGAGFPYGKDPSDSYIRIAPTFPAVDDLKKAAELLCICSIMVALENNAPLEV